MQTITEQFESPLDRAQFRRPTHRDGIELYRAHIVRHAFEPHTHEAFGIGAIEFGVERFRYRGSDHLASSGAIVLMNPDELHTGRAETEVGWRYQMIYIEPDVFGEITGQAHAWFADAVVNHPQQANTVSQLLNACWHSTDALEFDCQMAVLVETIQSDVKARKPAQSATKPRFDSVIEYMREHLARRMRLDDLAAVAGFSAFHFLRNFKVTHHATPHQMLMALRLNEAKRLLALGHPPASVAATTGLADQAHLTKAFARRYGVTPGKYQHQVVAKSNLLQDS